MVAKLNGSVPPNVSLLRPFSKGENTLKKLQSLKLLEKNVDLMSQNENEGMRKKSNFQKKDRVTKPISLEKKSAKKSISQKKRKVLENKSQKKKTQRKVLEKQSHTNK